ncbi:MAG TPA: hypothetical protein VF897_15600 [Roseiflexaceae bacterium]
MADEFSASSEHTASQADIRLFRTLGWLGRRRVAIYARGRRYVYRSVDQALRARRAPLRHPRRWAVPWVAAALIAALLALWLRPPLLLRAVDLARGLVGPAPVAYVETLAFRAGTWFRQARVRLGDSAPRWALEAGPTPVAVRRPAVASPAQLQPTLSPGTTAIQAVPTAVPDQPIGAPSPGVEIIARGGNLRGAARVVPENVLGLVWPGDRVGVLERRGVAGRLWLRVWLEAPAARRGGQGVAAGATGWISALLLEAERPGVAPTPAPQPRLGTMPVPPAAPPWLDQTPAPPI